MVNQCRTSNSNMEKSDSKNNLELVYKNPNICRGSKRSLIRIVITEGTKYVARSLAFRLLSDDIFGPDRDLSICFYDTSDSAVFLESTAIEVTAAAPKYLQEVQFSKDPETAFTDADLIFSIGKARDYNFVESPDLLMDPFFEDSVMETKYNAKAIEKFSKKDAKVIVLGTTAAQIVGEYAPSLPKENITGTMLVLQNFAAYHIARKTNRLAEEVKNIIIWGTNSKQCFPDCKYATFTDGKSVMEEINDDEWFKKTLPTLLRGTFEKIHYRIAEAYALAMHCKYLYQGTPDDEWICMSIVADGSYGWKPNTFYSHPVQCKNGQCNIVKGLVVENYLKVIFDQIITAVDDKVESALIIGRRPPPKVTRRTIRKSIMKL